MSAGKYSKLQSQANYYDILFGDERRLVSNAKDESEGGQGKCIKELDIDGGRVKVSREHDELLSRAKTRTCKVQERGIWRQGEREVGHDQHQKEVGSTFCATATCAFRRLLRSHCCYQKLSTTRVLPRCQMELSTTRVLRR